MKRNQSGFTLVEIAIVLVIIGLLLGGVLKGQELITQAKIKNIANDLNGVSAAVYGYQDRYRAYPGDDANAAARWTAAVTANGNGDSRVGGTGVAGVIACAAASTDEGCLFWQHLRLAGFIVGDTASRAQPQNAVNGIVQVQHGAVSLNGLVVCATGLPGKIAGAIDAQFDNGIPNTGRMRAVKSTDGVTYSLASPASEAAYVDDGGATLYAVCQPI